MDERNYIKTCSTNLRKRKALSSLGLQLYYVLKLKRKGCCHGGVPSNVFSSGTELLHTLSTLLLTYCLVHAFCKSSSNSTVTNTETLRSTKCISYDFPMAASRQENLCNLSFGYSVFCISILHYVKIQPKYNSFSFFPRKKERAIDAFISSRDFCNGSFIKVVQRNK